MGLLSECQHCHHYVSAKGMADHVRLKHGILPPKRAPVVSTMAKGSPKKKAANKRQPVPPAPEPIAASSRDKVIQAQLAQKARSQTQSRKNEATAAFLAGSAPRKVKSAPLISVWKEQVAKLAPTLEKLAMPAHSGDKSAKRALKDQRRLDASYALQLGRVPARRSVTVSGLRMTPLSRPQVAYDVAKRSTHVEVPCSCGGVNERCYRCYGKGSYEVSAEKAAHLEKNAVATPQTLKNGPASFASDSRGSSYGIRESGRFASAPDHDDFGEDSSS